MLKHFTWQQFLIAALVLSLIWYTVVILLFYRGRITALFSGKQRVAGPSGPLPHSWEEEVDDMAMEEDNLMGKAALPEGVSSISMDSITFAGNANAGTDRHEAWGNGEEHEGFDWESADDKRERQQGLIPDILEELKGIFYILETGQGGKKDFMALFDLVRTKYPDIRGTGHERSLNEYIRKNVLFPISDEELGNLWN